MIKENQQLKCKDPKFKKFSDLKEGALFRNHDSYIPKRKLYPNDNINQNYKKRCIGFYIYEKDGEGSLVGEIIRVNHDFFVVEVKLIDNTVVDIK